MLFRYAQASQTALRAGRGRTGIMGMTSNRNFAWSVTSAGSPEPGVQDFLLDSGNLIKAKISSRGATLTSVKMEGEEVTVSLDMLGGKATDSRGLKHYAGVTTGRVTGRMRSTFEANGKTYTLAENDGPNNIHGGLRGWDDYVWDTSVHEKTIRLSEITKLAPGQDDTVFKGVTFSRTSPDMEEGFPGTLEAKSTYLISEDDKLAFFFEVEFAKGQPPLKTPLSMTNHALWNLSGDFKETVRYHDLKLNCHKWLPADGISMPTGEM